MVMAQCDGGLCNNSKQGFDIHGETLQDSINYYFYSQVNRKHASHLPPSPAGSGLYGFEQMTSPPKKLDAFSTWLLF